jgi:integrase
MFRIQPLTYVNSLLGTEVSHHIILADTKSKVILISVANLYLHAATRSSFETSKRYATVIAAFFRFLSTQKKFQSVAVADYHAIASNVDIKKWQIARQVSRVTNSQAKPHSETILEDAKIVYGFFGWLIKNDLPTLVNVTYKNWIANFKRDSLLNYVKTRAKTVLDIDPIRVLDRECRQKRQKHLITDAEIKLLISCYPDTVYATLFCFELATALRPSELCNFPYAGKGENQHILPYNSMTQDSKSFEYTLIGKGRKVRTIEIPSYALYDIYKNYTEKEYPARKLKFKENYGSSCPPHILFLTKEGEPVGKKMISDATTYAVKKAHNIDPSFRVTNSFYQARHWWPTMMMIQHRGADLLKPVSDVMDAAFAQVLMNQMGHSDIKTTYKHYLDLARVLVITQRGLVNDIITEDFNIHRRIEIFGHDRSVSIPEGLDSE